MLLRLLYSSWGNNFAGGLVDVRDRKSIQWTIDPSRSYSCASLLTDTHRHRRRRLQAAPFSASPLIQLVAFHWRQFRVRMHECVSGWRHLTAPNGAGEAAQELLLLVDRVFVPSRQVHSTSSTADVAFDQQRDRGDVAIPRPFGSLGMTVLAGSFH